MNFHPSQAKTGFQIELNFTIQKKNDYDTPTHTHRFF